MNINLTDLFASLEIMGKGMLGLFVVCGSIMGLIMLISRLMTRKTDKS
jgi:hypothetical protein